MTKRSYCKANRSHVSPPAAEEGGPGPTPHHFKLSRAGITRGLDTALEPVWLGKGGGPAPWRAGAIDVGSNAIRMLAVEFGEGDRWTTLEAERATVRLGHDVFLTGRLTSGAMDAAVNALGGFKDRLEKHGVSALRAVATSAVREARNGPEFVEKVQRETGLTLDVISGAEEARLVHLAIARRVDLGAQRWLAVDLGGGSVEISLVDREGILWSESQAMGSVRLLEELSGAGDEPGRFRRLLTEYIATLRLPQMATANRPLGFIATGGNIESLLRFAVTVPGAEVEALPLATLRTTIELLARLSYAQRVAELGLREDRADVILPAAMVYEQLATLSGAEQILVPKVGVREGIVLDLASQHHAPQCARRLRLERLVQAAVALGRRYCFDEAHGRQVMHLALSLFDQLGSALGLGEEERPILAAAALLHDIGGFVSFKRHHKHSHYLIAQSDIPGLNAQETQVAALVARYHRKSEPALRHPEFACLGEADQARVQSLASLLRVADALDREHLQQVVTVKALLRKDQLCLELEGRGDLLLERWALARKSQLLTRLLEVSPTLLCSEVELMANHA